MSFCDPETHGARLSHGRPGYATIEIGHDTTRRGIVVQVDGCSSSQVLRQVVELAFDRAGDEDRLAVHDPGWWAVLIGWAGMRTTGLASIQRVTVPGELHAVLVVERSRMLEEHPLWPLLRRQPTAPWLDCRGESALRHGPADEELGAYALAADVDLPVYVLRTMFEQGVLEWEPGAVKAGRRRVVAAGQS